MFGALEIGPAADRPSWERMTTVPAQLVRRASKSCENISTMDTDAAAPLAPAVFHILMVLADDDRHGYAIIQAISERTAGKVRIGPATLYRSLQRMLEDGLVEELRERPSPDEDDERRRYYRITATGRKAARAEAQRLADLVTLARQSGLAPRKA